MGPELINPFDYGEFTYKIDFMYGSYQVNSDSDQEAIDNFIAWAEVHAPGYVYTEEETLNINQNELEDLISDSNGTTYINEPIMYNQFKRLEREKYETTVCFDRYIPIEDELDHEQGFIEDPYYGTSYEVLLQDYQKSPEEYRVKNQYTLYEILSILQSENFIPQSKSEGTNWFYSIPYQCPYTGISTSYTLHIKDIWRNDEVFEMINNELKRTN